MSLTSIPSSAIFRIQENYQQENSVTLKELINNNPTNENKLIKVIGGYEHTICLFNNGEMFGDGWNDYGQYGCNPLQINPEESKVNVTGMKRVNEKTNKILRGCKVIDVFTKFNFTIYLAINNTTKKQMLLGSGWNYGGCCSCNFTNDRHVHKISQCYFIQNKQNNEEEMTTELKNEKIIQIACGGCHLFMLTENYLNNEQFIYECGKNNQSQMSEGKDVPILKKSVKLMDFIKVNENNELKIKQIEGGSNCASFLTESGRVYSIGQNNFTNNNAIQQIPQDLFNNEVVKQLCDYQGVTLVLTNLGNVFIFNSNQRGKPVKYSFQKNILQMHTNKNTGFILFDDLSFFSKKNQGDKTVNLKDYLNSSIEPRINELFKYYASKAMDYDFYFCGDDHLSLVVTKKNDKNILAQKLKDNLLLQHDNLDGKNYFYDICYKF